MIDDLMRDPAVILQDVVVFGAGGAGDAFRDGLFPPTEHQPRYLQQPAGLFEALKGRGGERYQDLSELLVRDVGQFRAVVFGDDELCG